MPRLAAQLLGVGRASPRSSSATAWRRRGRARARARRPRSQATSDESMPPDSPMHDVGEAVLASRSRGCRARAPRRPRRPGRGRRDERGADAPPRRPTGCSVHARPRRAARPVTRPRGSSSRLRNTGRTSRSTTSIASTNCRAASDEVAVGVEHERGAVEDQLVLAADLVDVDEGARRVGRPGGQHALALGRAGPAKYGRGVDVDDQLGAARRPARRSARSGSTRPRRC